MWRRSLHNFKRQISCRTLSSPSSRLLSITCGRAAQIFFSGPPRDRHLHPRTQSWLLYLQFWHRASLSRDIVVVSRRHQCSERPRYPRVYWMPLAWQVSCRVVRRPGHWMTASFQNLLELCKYQSLRDWNQEQWQFSLLAAWPATWNCHQFHIRDPIYCPGIREFCARDLVDVGLCPTELLFHLPEHPCRSYLWRNPRMSITKFWVIQFFQVFGVFFVCRAELGESVCSDERTRISVRVNEQINGQLTRDESLHHYSCYA